MINESVYYKPPVGTLLQEDERGELDWITKLALDRGDRILIRELVMYVWTYSVSDSVSERQFLQRLIDRRLAQLREIAEEEA